MTSGKRRYEPCACVQLNVTLICRCARTCHEVMTGKALVPYTQGKLSRLLNVTFDLNQRET